MTLWIEAASSCSANYKCYKCVKVKQLTTAVARSAPREVQLRTSVSTPNTIILQTHKERAAAWLQRGSAGKTFISLKHPEQINISSHKRNKWLLASNIARRQRPTHKAHGANNMTAPIEFRRREQFAKSKFGLLRQDKEKHEVLTDEVQKLLKPAGTTCGCIREESHLGRCFSISQC